MTNEHRIEARDLEQEQNSRQTWFSMLGLFERGKGIATLVGDLLGNFVDHFKGSISRGRTFPGLAWQGSRKGNQTMLRTE